MNLGAVVGHIGNMAMSQTTTTLVMMNVINSGISIIAGAVIVGQGVYFGGRLVYQVIETASGFVIQKINDLRETKELKHTTVKIGEEEFELLDHDEDIVEIHVKDLTPEMFNQLDSRKLYRFIGSK